MIDDMLQDMQYDTSDATSVEFLENDKDVFAPPFNLWNRLEFYINPGQIWARHGRSLMLEKRTFRNDPSECLPKKAVARQACVCVCHPCHKKKGFCHWRPKQHTRGIASDPSEGLRQYSFFA